MKIKLICILLLSLSFLSAFSAENQEVVMTGDNPKRQGLSLAPLPVISYSSDLGFQYGLILGFHYFGDGARYPQFDHYLFLEYSRYTRGGQLARLFFDSDRIIRNIRTSLDFTFNDDRLAYFHGFNGYVSRYDIERERDNRIFYRFSNTSFRANLTFQGHVGDTPWAWTGGVNFMNFNVRTVDVDRLNANNRRNLPELLPNSTLFDRYVDWGIIIPEEIGSNWVNYLKVGFKYDSRDNRANPFSGMFSEVILQGAPSFLFNNSPHAKLALIHRHFVPVVPQRLVFAYRLFYQSSIGGKVPFYVQPLLLSSVVTSATTQGLGGARSLRGVSRNRVVGDGFLMANAEFRLQVFRVNLLGQFFDGLTNFFFDAGYITREIDMSQQIAALPESVRNQYFENTRQRIHASTGGGLKLVMNDNFVLSIDIGYALDRRDGQGIRIYVGTNYAF